MPCLARRWVSPALDPTYDLDAAYFLTTRPHIPHAGPFHREEQAKMRAWIAPIAALLVTTTVAAAQSPIPSLKGAWKGTRKNPAVRNDRVPFGVSEGGRRSRPGGDPYRPGSGWASDLGNDIGGKQRRQRTVCVGAHGGRQDRHRRRYRRVLPPHDLVAGPIGEMLRAECRFVPASDRGSIHSRGADGSPRRGDTRPRDRARADPGRVARQQRDRTGRSSRFIRLPNRRLDLLWKAAKLPSANPRPQTSVFR